MTAQEYRERAGQGGKNLRPLRDSGAVIAAAPVKPPVHVVPRPFRPVKPSEEFRDADLPVLVERPARTAAFSAALERRQAEQEREEQQRSAVEQVEITPVEPADSVAESAPPGERAPSVEPVPPKESAPVVQPQPPEEMQPRTEPQEPEQQVLLDEAGEPVAQDIPQWHMAGEVLDTYIIVEQGERVFFIDKHAAHERMNFDKLKARDYQPMSQLLLTPLTLNPPPEEGAALLAHRELLQRFGFELEDFGGGALLVRQVPDYLSVGQVEQTLSELAQRLMVTGTADPAAARDEVLHTMACKSAIKGGWKNDRRELQAVAEAVMSGAVRYCPHGRPVAIELTKKQLEKQFKRT
jgi:DNA mismatch repair protein MutL